MNKSKETILLRYRKSNEKENTKGITLIALIITIIILLILAGVAIRFTIGEDGIFDKSKKSAETYNEEAAKERLEIALADCSTEKYSNENYSEEYLINALEEQGFIVTGDNVNVDGWNFEINKETLKIENSLGNIPIPEDAVVKIGSNFYNTLQSAIDAVPEDNTDVIKNISENVTIIANKNVIINLNNKTLNNSEQQPIFTLNSNSNLTINNGNVTGNYTTEKPAILVNTNSLLNLNNANIKRDCDSVDTSWEAIELRGNLNMNGGKIENVESNAICCYNNNSSEVHIKNAEIYSENALTISFSDATTFEIVGGIIKSEKDIALVCKAGGIGTITGTQIISNAESNEKHAIVNLGEITLDGVNINANKGNAINNQSGGKITINGESTNISCNGTTSIPTIYNCGELTINAGNITHKNPNGYGVYNISGGKVTNNGGNISKSNL